jgi:hypothetical protein
MSVTAASFSNASSRVKGASSSTWGDLVESILWITPLTTAFTVARLQRSLTIREGVTRMFMEIIRDIHLSKKLIFAVAMAAGVDPKRVAELYNDATSDDTFRAEMVKAMANRRSRKHNKSRKH